MTMHPFRLNFLRRVHKPFLFIFLCALCLFGLAETTKFNPDPSIPNTPNTTPTPPHSPDLNNVPVVVESVRTMTSPSPISTGVGDDIFIMTHEDYDLGAGAENIFEEEEAIPVPVASKQLPFCKPPYQGTNAEEDNKGEHSSTKPEFENVGGDGTASNETSDKILLSNSNGLKAGKLIVVATLDGTISVLDHGGKVVWSICTGHFFSSTISTIQLSENGKFVKMIPSLSGGLYKYDGDTLSAMPLSAESLLRRSFKLSNDVVITGGKELRTFGVDLDSGNLKYECGMEGCHTPTKAELELKPDDESRIVLVIKKQLQTVRAIDSLTGSERWNFSVGSHELALAGVTEGCYQPAEEFLDYENTKHLFKMLIPEGIIFGADAENRVVWQHKFDSPISQAWTLENGRLQIVDPIKSAPIVDDFPSLYVGIHKQQLYVQESHTSTIRLRSKVELDFMQAGSEGIGQKTIEWKPRLAVVQNENTALAPFYSGPFFVYDRDETGRTPLAIEAPPNSSTVESELDDQDDTSAFVMMGLATLWFWWKEVLGISLCTAVVLNVLLMRPILRLVRRETVAEVTQFFVDRWTKDQEEQRALLPFISPAVSEESVLSDQERERRRTLSTSSSLSQSGLGEDQIVPFNSQYLREFEPIQCLGRGGFGVVFEARKKIDDRTYAVKRIALPNSEKSRDRVMREVKSLAKLDHKNIVRYFNAWIESPPLGWLEKCDPLWNCGALSSPSPTCDYPSGGFVESVGDSAYAFQSRDQKRDHFEISVPDKTPVDDDSFIVFSSSCIEEVNDDEEDSGAGQGDFTSKNNKNVSVRICKDSTDSWANSENDSNPNSLEICSDSINSHSNNPNSKFFARPTTLNIPSSTDSNSWARNPDTENNSGSRSSGPPETGSVNVMYLYIQQELCQKRTLQEWLRAEKQRNLRHVVRIFAQIVEAVEYIHSNNLIHRDLKPSNIFLAGETVNEDETSMTAKIGDFGLATTLVQNKLNDEPVQSTVEGEITTPKSYESVKLTGQVGTHLYMSPEQNQQKPYDYKVDIYSLGLIFFELLVPFSTEMERYDLVSQVRRVKFPNGFVDSHPQEHKLIKQMVCHRPAKRPDTSEVKLWLKDRIEKLQFENSSTVSTFRSKSFPSPLLVDDVGKKVGDKHFYKAHSFQ